MKNLYRSMPISAEPGEQKLHNESLNVKLKRRSVKFMHDLNYFCFQAPPA